MLVGRGGLWLMELLGLGHTISWHSSGQYSRILSNKYCCLSLERPGGVMMGGSSVGNGAHCLCSVERTLIDFSVLSV